MWMSDVHSVGGYTFAASLFFLGLTGWEVLLAMAVGVTAVYFLMNLIGGPSLKYGTPFPVVARMSFGVMGANVAASLRGRREREMRLLCRHAVLYSAAAEATPPCAWDQPAGSCMNVSTSASILGSNRFDSLATRSTSHQVARVCKVMPRSPRILRASG